MATEAIGTDYNCRAPLSLQQCISQREKNSTKTVNNSLTIYKRDAQRNKVNYGRGETTKSIPSRRDVQNFSKDNVNINQKHGDLPPHLMLIKQKNALRLHQPNVGGSGVVFNGSKASRETKMGQGWNESDYHDGASDGTGWSVDASGEDASPDLETEYNNDQMPYVGPCLTTGFRSPDKLFRRSNGFALPLHARQILSYSVFIFVLLVIYCFLLVQADYKGVIGTVVTLSAISLIISTGIATATNPVDTTSQDVKNDLERANGSNADRYSTSRCPTCGIVKSTSKHCKTCNKCVEGFDHHCVWLNTCVGKKNYWYFQATLISCLIFLVLIFGWSIATIYSGTKTGISETPWGSLAYSGGILASYVAPSFAILLSLPTLILVVQLIAFHVYIRMNNETTYAYIIRKAKEAEGSTTEEDSCLKSFRIDVMIARSSRKRNSTVLKVSDVMTSMDCRKGNH